MKINIYLLFLIIFLNGCATVELKQKREPLFYPTAPDEPRIQYLTSFASSQDVEGDSSAFAKFILGEAPVKSIAKPYGVTLKNGKIYICDTAYNTLEILDLSQKTFEYFDPQQAGQLVDPVNVDVSSDGTLYVADARRGQVILFDRSGRYLETIGDKGELTPTDVAVWRDRVFICDLKSKTVRVYTPKNGKFLYAIPSAVESDKDKKIFSPTNIDVDSSGNIYVTDTGGFNVKKYTSSGKLLQTFGMQGDVPGTFARPKGVAVDKAGRLYVVDAAFENIQVFNPNGELLMFFPEQQDAARLTLPAGIFIDYNNISYFSKYADESFKIEYLILVASQYGDRKISVFGFGRRK